MTLKRIIKITLFFLLSLFITFNLACKEKKEQIIYEEKWIANYDDEKLLNSNFIEDYIYVWLDKNLSNPYEICDNKLIERLISNIDYDSYMDISNYYFHYYISFLETTIANFRYKIKVYLKNPSKENALKAVHILERVDGIYSACLDGTIHADEMPTDPLYFSNNNYAGEWGIDKINATNAWNFSTGSNDIRIGVLDTAMSLHDDLIPNMVTEEVENNIEYNRLIGGDFIGASNYLSPNQMPDVVIGHATHIAGIIGAKGNNNYGTVGVNWNVTIVPLRVLDNYKVLDEDACLAAIEFVNTLWNTPYRIHILNLSFAGTLRGFSEDFYDALQSFQGIVVCCAGNDGYNIDSNPIYPAYYGSNLYTNHLDNIICVGATDNNDQRWDDSIFGDNTVDIYAPGVDIISTFPKEMCDDENINIINYDSIVHYQYGYHFNTGTSMATPFVTGSIALLMSINPYLSNQAYIDAIIYGSDTIEISVPNDNGIGTTLKNVKRLNLFGSIKYFLNNNISNYNSIFFPNNSIVSNNYAGTNNDSNFFVDNNHLLKINTNRNGTYIFNISSSSEIDVKLYDSSFNEININITMSNNNSTCYFSEYLTTQDGPYYLRINFDCYDFPIIQTSITPPHMHEYAYTWIDTTSHHVSCVCGDWYNDFHIVEEGAFNNGPLARCLLCGGIARFGGIIHRGEDSNYEIVTSNGSYRLPNGIIVLVEEDLFAFYNGILIIDGKQIIPFLNYPIIKDTHCEVIK